MKKLRKSFEDIDIDDSGEIDYDEFLEHMEERRNAFTDAVFRLIDENGDGVLEFDEFVSICGSFCMWNRGEILKFCFDTCKFLIFFFCPFSHCFDSFSCCFYLICFFFYFFLLTLFLS